MAAQEQAKRNIAAARERIEATRAVLAEAIVAAALAGARPGDIVRATDYSRERVRIILRKHGVDPD